MAYAQKLRRSARDEAVQPALLVCHKYGDLECPAASRRDAIDLSKNALKTPELRFISRIKPAHCFVCDRWDRAEDIPLVVAKTIEALRGTDRWGAGVMVEAAFIGFAELPPVNNWRTILGNARTLA